MHSGRWIPPNTDRHEAGRAAGAAHAAIQAFEANPYQPQRRLQGSNLFSESTTAIWRQLRISPGDMGVFQHESMKQR
jgi:hypothetical protein